MLEVRYFPFQAGHVYLGPCHFSDFTGHAETPPIVTASGTDHTRVRRLFSAGFSGRGLKQQEPLFYKYANLLANKLHTLNGKPTDVTVMMNLAAFDVMAEFAFGESLGLLDNSKYTDWVHHLITAVRGLPILQIIQYYPLASMLLEIFEPKWIVESKLTTLKYAADRVDKRLERGSSTYSLPLSHM